MMMGILVPEGTTRIYPWRTLLAIFSFSAAPPADFGVSAAVAASVVAAAVSLVAAGGVAVSALAAAGAGSTGAGVAAGGAELSTDIPAPSSVSAGASLA